ncbi:MAG TPA: M20 family metallopeptidase [Streptosporangiaceae bacterium]|nr:M20 family metallopeptidase [Streptosporangiaceae bacterium]
MTTIGSLRDDAQSLAPDLVGLRRRLHQHPEVGLQLPATQEIVLSELDGLGLELTTGTSTTAVTGVLRGARPGPSVLLRADMDGLPITEETGLEYASRQSGAMHACGHDLHTAMLVGTAKLLSRHRDLLAGDVVFMFQPGEEGWDGAAHMLREGVLDASGTRVSSAYGTHVMANTDRGVFTTKPGILMAASAALTVTVRGSGGHGSSPHRAKDPITVAAQVVGDLQTMVTRRFDIFDPLVISVGQFKAGTARTIIPDDATVEATVRAFTPQTQDRAETEITRVCRSVAAAYDVDVDVIFRREYPATVNHTEHAAFVESVVTETFGPERFQAMAFPRSGSEDFSRVIAEVPGCYLMLGARVGEAGTAVPDNHSAHVRFDESVLPDGALLHARLAIEAVRRDGGRSGAEH